MRTDGAVGAQRWLFLLALAVPAWLVMALVLGSYPPIGYLQWLAIAVVAACVAQVFRSRRMLSLGVLLWYIAASAQCVWDESGALQDLWLYGGEDHSRWEGWRTEWPILALAAFLVCVTCLLARHVLQDRGIRLGARDELPV